MTQNMSYESPPADSGPVSWKPFGRGVQSMGFDLSVEWGDAWASAVEPALRGSVIAEDADDVDPDRPSWVARQMGCGDGSHRAFSVMVETVDLGICGEMYSWSPGFFNVYTDMAPAAKPPASVRVWLREQLLRSAAGAAGALALVSEYFNDLGAKVSAPRLGGMELAADFLVEGELNPVFLSAHAPADRPLRRLASYYALDSSYAKELEHALGVTLRPKSAADVLARGGTVGTALDRASAERVWCVRFVAYEPVLRRMGADPTRLSTPEGVARAWRWLSTEQFSLRVPGPYGWANRPLHPWWEAVRDVWND